MPPQTDISSKVLVSRLEIKAIDENAHTFQGMASTWDLDLGGDVIEKGAFKRTLKNWKSAKRNVPLVDSHNTWGTVLSVVGQMDTGEETDNGLLGDFSMLSEDPTADGVFRRVAKGLTDGLSIGYNAVKVRYPTTEDERQKGIYRYLEEVKLREVSVVLFPMNTGARIDLTTVKGLLAKAQRADLPEDELQELASVHKQIGDLLLRHAGTAGTEDDLPTPGEVAADPKAADELAARIDRLFAARLDTRISAARHSGEAVLTNL